MLSAGAEVSRVGSGIVAVVIHTQTATSSSQVGDVDWL